MRRFLSAVAILTALLIVSACPKPQQPPTTTPTTPAAPPAKRTRAVATTPAAALTCDTIPAPPGAMFPSNFDYPQSASTIASWPDGHRQRLHAYCVFAGLNYPWLPGKPTWSTWPTTSQAFTYQYNAWPKAPAEGADAPVGVAEERTVPINHARSRAAGPVGAIVNPAPVYYVSSAVANNQTYKNAGCLQAVTDKNNNILGYTLKDGEQFQSNGDIMIAAVSYSPFAFQSIQQQQLANAAVLDAGLPAQATSPSKSIKPMSQNSIVLKVMLWPVSGTSPTALPYWTWDNNSPGSASDNQYAGYEMQQFWTNAVAITNGSAPSSVSFLYGVKQPDGVTALGPNTYQNPQAVPLSRFYYKTYQASDWSALSPCDQAIIDASAWWTYNRGFQAGDSLVLVAMHIMTKEQPSWTFQSAWWHPDAFACTPTNRRFCQDQPASVPNGDTTYKNYNMVTTYGQRQQQQSPNDNYYAPSGSTANTWPVAYNPYIELAASHPITTNCMNCHHRAAWPPNTELFPTKVDPVAKNRFSAYLQTTPANPNPLDTFHPMDPTDTQTNAIFNGLLMLDSMWAVSDRAGYPSISSPAPKKKTDPDAPAKGGQ